MIFALLSLLGLAAGFGGLAWGYFVLDRAERTERILASIWRVNEPRMVVWDEVVRVKIIQEWPWYVPDTDPDPR
ncbi:MAG TPA: hypothetical protein VF414_17850 [Thermoanaerobaculia bacterium]